MILTEEIENSLKNEADIDDLLKQIHDMDFSEYIHHLFKKYHLKEADIIRKSGLERTYAYKIIRGEKGKNLSISSCYEFNPKRNKSLIIFE